MPSTPDRASAAAEAKRPTPLTEIANAMYAELAKTNGQLHHPLSHGLNIVLQHAAGPGEARPGEAGHERWLLKLGRQKVYPSVLETVLCKRAFRLADDMPETRLDPSETGWHVTAIDWTGPVPVPRPGPTPKETRR